VKRNAFRDLMGKPERMRKLRRIRSILNDNIKEVLKLHDRRQRIGLIWLRLRKNDDPMKMVM